MLILFIIEFLRKSYINVFYSLKIITIPYGYYYYLFTQFLIIYKY